MVLFAILYRSPRMVKAFRYVTLCLLRAAHPHPREIRRSQGAGVLESRSDDRPIPRGLTHTQLPGRLPAPSTETPRAPVAGAPLPDA